MRIFVATNTEDRRFPSARLSTARPYATAVSKKAATAAERGIDDVGRDRFLGRLEIERRPSAEADDRHRPPCRSVLGEEAKLDMRRDLYRSWRPCATVLERLASARRDLRLADNATGNWSLNERCHEQFV